MRLGKERVDSKIDNFLTVFLITAVLVCMAPCFNLHQHPGTGRKLNRILGTLGSAYIRPGRRGSLGCDDSCLSSAFSSLRCCLLVAIGARCWWWSWWIIPCQCPMGHLALEIPMLSTCHVVRGSGKTSGLAFCVVARLGPFLLDPCHVPCSVQGNGAMCLLKFNSRSFDSSS
jgi:hypothetical protein